jgi:ribosomal protein S20
MEALNEAELSENKIEKKEVVAEKLKKAVSQLQKTNSKGVMHKNTVSRKIGRLTRKFNKVFTEK